MSTATTSVSASSVSGGWVEEFFYFGNAVWPSDATWRTRGDELQERVSIYIDSFSGDPESEAVWDEVLEKVLAFEQKWGALLDTEPLLIGDHMYVIGWWDATGNADYRQKYLDDKRDGMK